MISEDTAAQSAEDEDAESCEEGLERSFASSDAEESIAQLEDAEIGEATVDGDAATVAVTSVEGDEGEVSLVMEDDEWKVDAAR